MGHDDGHLTGSVELVAMVYWQANQLEWFARAVTLADRPGVNPSLRSGTLWVIASYYR